MGAKTKVLHLYLCIFSAVFTVRFGPQMTPKSCSNTTGLCCKSKFKFKLTLSFYSKREDI